MILYNDYEYPSDDYVEYFVTPDILENVISYTDYINLILQFLSILVNFFHLSVLFQKELRSNFIFIFMTGICISDLFNFSIEFYFSGVKRDWYPRVYTISNIDCLRSDFVVFNVGFEVLKTISSLTRPISVILALFMEVIRTLLLNFPWAKLLSSSVTARCTIVLVSLFWMLYYSWNFVFVTSLWYPDNLCDDPYRRPLSVNVTENVFALPATVSQSVYNREMMEHWIRIIPAVFYPMITLELIFKLRELHKNQKQPHKDNHENLPKLIMFMTISFMLSEGVDGIRSLVMVNMYDWRKDHLIIVKMLASSEYIVRMLRSFNTISHPFICYMMSVHYRNTIKRMIGYRKIMIKVVPIESVEHSHGSHHGKTGTT